MIVLEDSPRGKGGFRIRWRATSPHRDVQAKRHFCARGVVLTAGKLLFMDEESFQKSETHGAYTIWCERVVAVTSVPCVDP